MPLVDEEITSRVLWSGLAFEKHICIYSNLPTQITPPPIKLPSPFPHETQEDIDLFFRRVGLCRIFCGGLSGVCGPRLSKEANVGSVQPTLWDLDSRYCQWIDSLESTLSTATERYDEQSSGSTQSQLLAFHGHLLRLATHRSVVVAAARSLSHSFSKTNGADENSAQGRTNQRAFDSQQRRLLYVSSITNSLDAGVAALRIIHHQLAALDAVCGYSELLSDTIYVFVSLTTVLTINLSPYSAFIRTRPAEILDAMLSVRDVVKRGRDIDGEEKKRVSDIIEAIWSRIPAGAAS